MLKVEFHCHTSVSKDGYSTPGQLIAACRRKGIDRVVVTDHNQIAGALAARQIDPERVIVGEEIMTTRGELLAAFVKERIPARLEPLDAIRRLREQGAFISVSHPFDLRRNGAWGLRDLLEIAPLVDAIEVFNSRCMDDEPNRLAQGFAREHQLLGTAGSDAHIPWELGRGVMWLPEFTDPASLCRALESGRIEGKLSPGWVHLVSFGTRMAKQSGVLSTKSLTET